MRALAILAALAVAAGAAASPLERYPLAPGRYPDTRPQWSPDGERIAFLRGNDLYVMRADGSGQRKLVADAFEWSPGGALLALARDGTILIAAADGSGARPVATGSSFVWSPSGRELAFGRDFLYVLDVASGSIRQVSREDGVCRQCSKGDRQPVWSADGSRIAFVRWSAPDSRYTYTRVWVARADGTASAPVTAGGYHRRLSWSPDATHLAFLTTSTTDPDDEATYLHTLDLTSGLELTHAAAEWFEWAPTSSRLAVAEVPGGLVTQAPDGGRRVLLTTEFAGASWSPDGRLAFSKDGFVRVGDGAGRAARTIARGAWPTFTREGRLAFARPRCGADQGIYATAAGSLTPSRVTTGCVVAGTNEADELVGTAAADTIIARGGDDLVRAGAGRDRLDGGGNPDRLFAGPGDDVLLAVDGWRDAVDCGAGRDRVTADPVDDVAPSCEVVHRVPAPG